MKRKPLTLDRRTLAAWNAAQERARETNRLRAWRERMRDAREAEK